MGWEFIHTVLLSAHQFAVLTCGRVAGFTADMDDAQIAALVSAQMDPRHNHLNALLDEEGGGERVYARNGKTHRVNPVITYPECEL